MMSTHVAVGMALKLHNLADRKMSANGQAPLNTASVNIGFTTQGVELPSRVLTV